MSAKRSNLSDIMGQVAESYAAPEQAPDAPHEPVSAESARPLPDGRSLRATGRTHQFSTRIKSETHDKLKWLALSERITLGELIERMTDMYERQKAAR